MTRRNGLYIPGQNPPVSHQQVLDTVGPTAFDLVLPAFLDLGESTYDGVSFQGQQLYTVDGGKLTPSDPQAIAELAQFFETLRSGGATPRKAVISIQNVEPLDGNVAAFANDFVTVMEQLHLDGLDFDYEGGQDDEHQQLLADVAVHCVQAAEAAGTPVPLITAAPFFGADWWGGVLKKAKLGSGNAFAWWNVQFYTGLSNPSPSDGASTFATWEQAVAAADAGVGDPSAFLVPGINAYRDASPRYSPAEYRELLENVKAGYPDFGGGFLWQYGSVASDAVAWGAVVGSL